MAKGSKTDRGRKAAGQLGDPLTPAAGFRLSAPSREVIEVAHTHTPMPPPYTRRERIHPRRILPRVREGIEREFPSSTSEVTFRPRPSLPAGVRAATDDLAVLTNAELAGPGQQQLASNVNEPSVAVNGEVVFFTGNWYAARSIDGGKTFQYLDPFTAFPDPANLGYCCDQVVQYIASIDVFVWLLRYGPKSGLQADNIQRLAFAKTADVAAGRWRLFDITTKNLGVAGQFLDFPDMAVGVNDLYVTTNIFTPAGQSGGAAVLRIPIASIAKGPVTAERFVSPTLNSFRMAQNCGTRAFFATHQDTSTLNVFTWDESAAQPASNLVEVARWITGRLSIPDARRPQLARPSRFAHHRRNAGRRGVVFRLGCRR